VIRASNLGACTKALAAERLGFKPLPVSEVLEAAFERGHQHEAELAKVMREEGWVITDEQEEVAVYFDGVPSSLGAASVGHIDGIACAPDSTYERCWEAKNVNAWRQYERAHKTDTWTPLTNKYRWQSSVYMVALGMEQMVSCLDDGRVKSFIIEVPPFSREQILERVAAIEALVELPADCEAGCRDDWGCPFRYLHTDDRVITEDEEIDKAAKRYEYWRLSAKDSEAQQKAARSDLERLLGDRPKVETTTSIVTSYSQKNPVRYDFEKMRDDGIEVEKYALPVTSSSRLKVTRKGVDKVNEGE
jgi:hypothetical protein